MSINPTIATPQLPVPSYCDTRLPTSTSTESSMRAPLRWASKSRTISRCQ